MPKATVTKASIARAIEATKSCGLPVSGVEISADGTIRVLTEARQPIDTVATTTRIDKPSGPKQWRT